MPQMMRPQAGIRSQRRPIFKGFQSGTDGWLVMLEQEVRRQLRPPWASRQEVHQLSRRIARLQRRLQSSASSLRGLSGARPTVFRGARGQHSLDSQRYAELFWDEA